MSFRNFSYMLAVSLGGAALAAGGAQAQSAQTQFGSAAFQSVRSCSDLPTAVNCMGPNTKPRIETYIPGGVGQEVNSTIFPQTGGKIVSRVQPGQLDLPIFKSGVWAGSDTRVASSLVSYMGFTFNGPSGTPYALDALIDWKSSGAPLAYQDIAEGRPQLGEYGGEGFGSFSIALFDAAYFPTINNASDLTNFVGSVFCNTPGVISLTGAGLVTPTGGFHEASILLNSTCGGGALTLNNGGNYVLLTTLVTVANRGGFFDATNTVRVRLSETLPIEVTQTLLNNVVTGRSLVPEPGSWMMLIAGFGLIGQIARQRRRSAAA